MMLRSIVFPLLCAGMLIGCSSDLGKTPLSPDAPVERTASNRYLTGTYMFRDHLINYPSNDPEPVRVQALVRIIYSFPTDSTYVFDQYLLAWEDDHSLHLPPGYQRGDMPLHVVQSVGLSRLVDCFDEDCYTGKIHFKRQDGWQWSFFGEGIIPLPISGWSEDIESIFDVVAFSSNRFFIVTAEEVKILKRGDPLERLNR